MALRFCSLPTSKYTKQSVSHNRRQVVAAAAVQSHPNQQQQQGKQQQSKGCVRSLQQQVEVLQALTQWAESNLPQYMADAQQQWQPSLLLPDLSSEAGWQQLRELREEAQKLPTDILVVLAGLAVHAALVPAQLSSSWGGAPILRDHSGADPHIWARWRRQCAADTNKTRSALSFYCYCCGCMDTRALDVSSHVTLSSPISNGGSRCFAPAAAAAAAADTAVSGSWAGTQEGETHSSSSSGGGGGGRSQAAAADSAAGAVVGCPYQQLFRELLQVRMLRVMYGNMTNLANYHGAASLARLTAAAASDFKRHELAILATCCQLAAMDPQGAVTALAAVVTDGVTLPGCHMDDGWHQHNNAATAAAAAAAGSSSGSDGSSGSSLLYQDWMTVADCLGVWCVSDIAAAVQDLNGLLKVSELAARPAPLGAALKAAASFVLGHPAQLRRLAEVQLEGRLRDRRRGRTRSVAFSWVFGRDVLLA